jgi:hypothetical protein
MEAPRHEIHVRNQIEEMGLGGMTCSELVTKNKKQKKNQNRT